MFSSWKKGRGKLWEEFDICEVAAFLSFIVICYCLSSCLKTTARWCIWKLLIESALLKIWMYMTIIVLILDGNSEYIHALVRSNFCYLIFLRHFIRSKAVTNRILIHRRASCSELPSNASTLVYMFCTFAWGENREV